ncbi:MAG: phosphatase PAP2 family protein [Gemmatimonadaceae bacterium]|nr:phosphatase PAP2 family protein [Gemmatimonadaceae bacterium]
MTRFARIIPLAALVVSNAAQAQTAPSAPVGPLFTYRDAILAGSVLAAARLVHPLDDHYAQRLQDSSTQANAKLKTLSTFVRRTAAPGAFIISGSLYAIGRLGGNRKLASLGLHGTEALVVSELVAVAIKGVVGRQRPNVRPRNPRSYQFLRGVTQGDDFRSFPSGHTVAAFAAAAAFTAETSRNAPNTTWFVAPLMYGGAALAGVSRMYDNRHWATDVLVGAGIGTFAGLKVVRYHDSRPGNGIDRFFLAGSLVPNETGGHSLRWSVIPGALAGRR